MSPSMRFIGRGPSLESVCWAVNTFRFCSPQVKLSSGNSLVNDRVYMAPNGCCLDPALRLILRSCIPMLRVVMPVTFGDCDWLYLSPMSFLDSAWPRMKWWAILAVVLAIRVEFSPKIPFVYTTCQNRMPALGSSGWCLGRAALKVILHAFALFLSILSWTQISASDS